MTGRTIESIQAALLAALVGQTLTTTYLAIPALHAAEDDRDPAIGAYGMADGGVVVWPDGGGATDAAAPRTSGGRTQRQVSHVFKVEVTYSVGGVIGQRLAIDAASIIRQLWNLIEAGAEPQSGTVVYSIPRGGIRYSAPRRHASRPDFYVQDIVVTVPAFWGQ